MQEQSAPGLGEQENLPGGGIAVGDAVPEMPPGSQNESDTEEVDTKVINTEEPGGGLTADDLAQPTTTSDPTGDRATGLTGMRGG